MRKEIIFILLNEYADWEGAFIASSLNAGVMPGSEVKYTTRVAAPTMDAVSSIGGFHTLPDYSFQTIPTDYAALILIGGMQWGSPEAEQVVPLVQDALQRGLLHGKAWFPERRKTYRKHRSATETMGRRTVYERSRIPNTASRQRQEYRHRQRYGAIRVLPRTASAARGRYSGKNPGIV